MSSIMAILYLSSTARPEVFDHGSKWCSRPPLQQPAVCWLSTALAMSLLQHMVTWTGQSLKLIYQLNITTVQVDTTHWLRFGVVHIAVLSHMPCTSLYCMFWRGPRAPSLSPDITSFETKMITKFQALRCISPWHRPKGIKMSIRMHQHVFFVNTWPFVLLYVFLSVVFGCFLFFNQDIHHDKTTRQERMVNGSPLLRSKNRFHTRIFCPSFDEADGGKGGCPRLGSTFGRARSHWNDWIVTPRWCLHSSKQGDSFERWLMPRSFANEHWKQVQGWCIYMYLHVYRIRDVQISFILWVSLFVYVIYKVYLGTCAWCWHWDSFVAFAGFPDFQVKANGQIMCKSSFVMQWLKKGCGNNRHDELAGDEGRKWYETFVWISISSFHWDQWYRHLFHHFPFI